MVPSPGLLSMMTRLAKLGGESRGERTCEQIGPAPGAKGMTKRTGFSAVDVNAVPDQKSDAKRNRRKDRTTRVTAL